MDFRKAEERYKGEREEEEEKKEKKGFFKSYRDTRAIGGWRSNGQKKKKKKVSRL